jgi:asparagine synthase (glutamine-hydrolysing)
MCGICGVLSFDRRPLPQATLEAMTQVLAHRGPDGQRIQLLSDGSRQIGLGHTRLRVIDLSEIAAQPMANDDGSLWLTFNGEIYNYRELRGELERRGVHFRTSSDTEVLLRLYEAEGERCVDKLEGMFAFAMWDGRTHRLFLARDRIGKKPLFYYSTRSFFAFASEIKALLRHPEISPEVDVDALPAFFLYGYVPTPQTLYRGVRKLPPGHLMLVGADGEIRTEAYWDLPIGPEHSRGAPPATEAAARVRELLTAAVRRRLIADVPLGAFLSGGIDSSIIVGLMSRLMQQPVRTFSIGFAGDAHFDETSFAQLASKRFQTIHTEFVVKPSAVDLVERLVWHHDGPFADSSAVPTYILSRLTRDHVTVALNGDGGDELFAGYLRFYAAVLAERVPTPIRRTANWMLSGLPEWGGHRGPWRRLQKFVGSATLPFNERFSRWIAVFYEDLTALLPGVRRDGNRPLPLSFLEPHLRRSEPGSPLTRLLYLNLKTYLLDDLLVKVDRCSMAHALEARSPFLDRELMEYVFTLPDAMKVRGGRTKVILRQAFADLIPTEILRRGKMGFGVPLRKWFVTDLRDYLEDTLLASDAKLGGYVDQRYVLRLYQAHRTGRADYSHRLWTLLTFELWLRQLGSWKAAPMAGGVGVRAAS